jgi:hypothetical protein
MADAQMLRVKVSEGFAGAGDEVWGAIIRGAATGRTRADDRIVSEYALSDEFSELLIEIDGFAEPPTDSTRGRVHSLDESFARVNRDYFGDAMPRPRLVWNGTLTARKFGHYRFDRDTVMLSISLDDEQVPAHVVDFVMYHELLHKQHRAVPGKGRLLVHTPAFRADERQFAQYEDAVRQLSALARRRTGASATRVKGASR